MHLVPKFIHLVVYGTILFSFIVLYRFLFQARGRVILKNDEVERSIREFTDIRNDDTEERFRPVPAYALPPNDMFKGFMETFKDVKNYAVGDFIIYKVRIP